MSDSTWIKEFDEKFGRAYISDKSGGYFIGSYLIEFIQKVETDARSGDASE